MIYYIIHKNKFSTVILIILMCNEYYNKLYILCVQIIRINMKLFENI